MVAFLCASLDRKRGVKVTLYPMSTFSSGPKYFHYLQAQKALTLVGPIVHDCMKLYQAAKKVHPDDQESITYYQELAQRYYEELTQIGCILRDPARGTVDFPTLYQGRTVALSWHFGEKKISYWHEMQTGFVARKKITPTFLSEIIIALHQTPTL